MLGVLKRVGSHAWTGLRRDPPALRRALLLPASLLLAANLTPASSSAGLNVLLGMVSLFAYIVLVVHVHRHMLMPAGSEAASLRIYMAFAMIFFIGFVALMLVAFAASLLPRLSFVVVPAILLGLIYFGARFSLVVPDQALGRNTPLGTVWSWSNGNGWKLAFVLVVPMIVGESALWLVTFWMDDTLADFVQLILSLPLMIFGVAVLSCAYDDLSSWDGQTGLEGGPVESQGNEADQ